MHDYLLERLECPACHGELDWAILERDARRILTAGARCRACRATYSVREGIGLFLAPEVWREDAWQQAESGLTQFLRENPEVERRLMQVPLDTLNPADQFMRALVEEARGDTAQAEAAANKAWAGLYTPEYLACWDSQCDYLTGQLAASHGPILDLASGRCHLVKHLARTFQRPIVASDISPRGLRKSRDRLKFHGLYDSVSLLAFDARQTPFKTGAIETLTTNLGLPNIQDPRNLLSELRRVVSGVFLAISHFYPESDEANAQAIREAKLEALLYRDRALASFAEAGWQAEVANVCWGKARPTLAGVVIDGARIDSLPIADTTLEWCVLAAGHRGSHAEQPVALAMQS